MKATGNATAIAGQLQKASIIAASLTTPMPIPPQLNMPIQEEGSGASRCQHRQDYPATRIAWQWVVQRTADRGKASKESSDVQNTTAGHLPGRDHVNLFWRDGRRQADQSIGQSGVLV
jgi:hypothetical protein